MTATVDLMKCACEKCLCIVKVDSAVNKDGQYYCSEACADGHKTVAGCGHSGCGCSD
ncbi:MAG: metallothionein [Rivularia sp. (in: cyanobacteria)]